MRIWVLVLVAAGLAGCVNPKADGNVYGGLFGQQVTGNSVSASVSNVWSEADALPLADQHCGKFGRAARINKMTGHTANFDCVAP
ncbi:hypothetical protein [Methylobacterium sp. WL9]|uniref:hypothetical protein n=1 Tax=Methylobacterium sp. WL9 TaxID=2603898 RepID=UPI0011C81EF9|nr:hypothetical protein [Methylobacterium sp. WL9]TXN20781.1 hypothetical protein FV217_16765 [Methylobacterium sp. WL9]